MEITTTVLDNYIVTIDECDTFISVKNDICKVIETSILTDLKDGYAYIMFHNQIKRA
jgi:hypothetical protein